MKLWLNQLKKNIPSGLGSPVELARFELESAFPGVSFNLCVQDSMGDAYRIDPQGPDHFLLTGGNTGLLYAAYRFIEDSLCGKPISGTVSSSPVYALRMVNCWDNADGEIERGYSGRSLFFREGRLDYSTERIRTLGRLLASVGLNVLCINNVNVHDPAQLLLEAVLENFDGLLRRTQVHDGGIVFRAEMAAVHVFHLRNPGLFYQYSTPVPL